jgi:hypothetical protein
MLPLRAPGGRFGACGNPERRPPSLSASSRLVGVNVRVAWQAKRPIFHDINILQQQLSGLPPSHRLISPSLVNPWETITFPLWPADASSLRSSQISCYWPAYFRPTRQLRDMAKNARSGGLGFRTSLGGRCGGA